MSVSTAPTRITEIGKTGKQLLRRHQVFGIAVGASVCLHLSLCLAVWRSHLMRPPVQSSAAPLGSPSENAVRRLNAAEYQMESLRDERLKAYAKMLQERGATADRDLQSATQEAANWQAKAMEALKAMQEAPPKTTSASPPPADPAQKLTEALSGAAQAQDRAIRALRFAATASPEAARQFSEAAAKQSLADAAARKALDAAMRASFAPHTKANADQQKALAAQRRALDAQQKALDAQRLAAKTLTAYPASASKTAKRPSLSDAQALQTAAGQLGLKPEDLPPTEAPRKGVPAAPQKETTPAAKKSGTPAHKPPSGQAGEKGQKATDHGPHSANPQEPGPTPGNDYAAAKSAEQKLNETYRQTRALDLALIRRMPVSEAMKEVALATPDRTAPLTGGGADAERLRRAEMAAMAARGQRLLDQAQNNLGPDAAAFAEKMSQLAQEEATQPARDLSGLMTTRGAAITADRNRAAMPGDPGYGAAPPMAAPPPPAVATNLMTHAFPGRRLASGDAPSVDWMYLDTWYTVGPFPNPARQNINTKFPPEDAVDLDAVYSGKDNKPVRWHFVQSGGAEIIPYDPQEYSIYYAYTELWSDRARDIWIAIGSDDKSTLWINDQMVWMSSDVLKGWRIGEGLRRVHLVSGRNRLLLRCENGWRDVGYSVVVSLK